MTNERRPRCAAGASSLTFTWLPRGRQPDMDWAVLETWFVNAGDNYGFINLK